MKLKQEKILTKKNKNQIIEAFCFIVKQETRKSSAGFWVLRALFFPKKRGDGENKDGYCKDGYWLLPRIEEDPERC